MGDHGSAGVGWSLYQISFVCSKTNVNPNDQLQAPLLRSVEMAWNQTTLLVFARLPSAARLSLIGARRLLLLSSSPYIDSFPF